MTTNTIDSPAGLTHEVAGVLNQRFPVAWQTGIRRAEQSDDMRSQAHVRAVIERALAAAREAAAEFDFEAAARHADNAAFYGGWLAYLVRAGIGR